MLGIPPRGVELPRRVPTALFLGAASAGAAQVILLLALPGASKTLHLSASHLVILIVMPITTIRVLLPTADRLAISFNFWRTFRIAGLIVVLGALASALASSFIELALAQFAMALGEITLFRVFARMPSEIEGLANGVLVGGQLSVLVFGLFASIGGVSWRFLLLAPAAPVAVAFAVCRRGPAAADSDAPLMNWICGPALLLGIFGLGYGCSEIVFHPGRISAVVGIVVGTTACILYLAVELTHPSRIVAFGVLRQTVGWSSLSLEMIASTVRVGFVLLLFLILVASHRFSTENIVIVLGVGLVAGPIVAGIIRPNQREPRSGIPGASLGTSLVVVVVILAAFEGLHLSILALSAEYALLQVGLALIEFRAGEELKRMVDEVGAPMPSALVSIFHGIGAAGAPLLLAIAILIARFPRLRWKATFYTAHVGAAHVHLYRWFGAALIVPLVIVVIGFQARKHLEKLSYMTFVVAVAIGRRIEFAYNDLTANAVLILVGVSALAVPTGASLFPDRRSWHSTPRVVVALVWAGCALIVTTVGILQGERRVVGRARVFHYGDQSADENRMLLLRINQEVVHAFPTASGDVLVNIYLLISSSSRLRHIYSNRMEIVPIIRAGRGLVGECAIRNRPMTDANVRVGPLQDPHGRCMGVLEVVRPLTLGVAFQDLDDNLYSEAASHLTRKISAILGGLGESSEEA
jgi:hypothetical protein